MYEDLAKGCLEVGLAVRKAVNDLPRSRRGNLGTSLLKPSAGQKCAMADIVGEQAGFEVLERLSSEVRYPIHVFPNEPFSSPPVIIGGNGEVPGRDYVIWCSFDAVDGTVKVAGLGNDPTNNIYRVGGNGFWGAGIALTVPTKKCLEDLTIGDFEIAALVEGNPQRYRSHPTNAVCWPDPEGMGGTSQTFEMDEYGNTGWNLLSTSSQTNISQSMINFEAFQAYDRKTARDGSEQLANAIFPLLINRNEGGAFDIVRFYANISEVLCQLLERKDGGIEPQGAGAITLNENYASLIPFVPIIEGAGGSVVEFSGKPMSEHYLRDPRPDSIIAANDSIAKSILSIVEIAKSDVR